MSSTATISIQLEAQTATLKKGFDEAKGAINSLDKNMAGSVAKGMAMFNAGLLAMKGALASVRGVINAVAESMASMAATGDFADRIGIDVEALQALRFAAEQTGGKAAVLDTALQRMGRRIATAAQSGGPLEDTLAKLGLNAKALAELPLEQQLLAFSDALTQSKTAGEANAAIMALMDTEGVALSSTLRGGSDALLALTNKAKENGIVNEDMIRMSQEGQAALVKLNAAWTTFKNILSSYVIPAITAVVGAMTKLIASMGRLFGASGKSNPVEALSAGAKQAVTTVDIVDKEAETARKKSEAEAERAAERMKSRGESIASGLRSPAEVYRDTIAELNELVNNGALSWDVYQRGVKKAAEELMAGKNAAADWKTPSIGAVTRGSAEAFSAVQSAGREREDAERRHREMITWQARLESAIKVSGITLAPVNL